MLNKVLPINPLPTKIASQLQQVGDFYVCTQCTRDFIGELIVKIGEDVYYRYMNFTYLPQPPESLPIEKVIEICNLRLDHMNELVDPNYNRRIVAAMIDYIVPDLGHFTAPIKALDFGCGSGLSSKLLLEQIPDLEIIGVDISEKAVHQSLEQGLTTFLSHSDEPLPFEDAAFDIIFAVFVMHFNIDVSTLVELHRVLRPSGKFMFNIYQRDIDGVIEQLQEAGFCCIDVWKRTFGIDGNYMIVSCGILPPCKTVFH